MSNKYGNKSLTHDFKAIKNISMKKRKIHYETLEQVAAKETATNIMVVSVMLFTAGATLYGYKDLPDAGDPGARAFYAAVIGCGAFFSSGIGAIAGHHLFKTTSKITVFPFVRDKAKCVAIHGRNGIRGTFMGAIVLGYQAMPIIHDQIKNDFQEYYGVGQVTQPMSKPQKNKL